MGFAVIPCRRCGRPSVALVCGACRHAGNPDGGSIEGVACPVPSISIGPPAPRAALRRRARCN